MRDFRIYIIPGPFFWHFLRPDTIRENAKSRSISVNPKPYNFLGPETDRENALYRAEMCFQYHTVSDGVGRYREVSKYINFQTELGVIVK